jgi:hypothetical protein
MALHTVDENINSVDSAVHTSLGTTGVSAITEGQMVGKLVTKDAQMVVNDGSIDRVVVGRLEDGTYGIKVSQSGVDVGTARNDQLVMSSQFDMLKVFATGTVSLTTGAGVSQATAVVTHNLGYGPIVTGSISLVPGAGGETCGFPGIWLNATGSPFVPKIQYGYYTTDPNSITLFVTSDGFSGTYTIRYYILVETAVTV